MGLLAGEMILRLHTFGEAQLPPIAATTPGVLHGMKRSALLPEKTAKNGKLHCPETVP